MVVAVRKRPITVDQFIRMGETGILKADERLELARHPLAAAPDSHARGQLRAPHLARATSGRQITEEEREPVRRAWAIQQTGGAPGGGANKNIAA